MLLHAIIKPVTKRKTAAKQLKKFTIKDAQNSFIMRFSTVYEADQFFENQTRMALTSKINIQPFIFVIGEHFYSENQYYIYCDKIRYKLVSPVAALDCTFKLFQVFYLEYPIQSKAVWQFIQMFFYEITTPHDDAFPSVDLLINKLNLLNI